MHIIYYDSNYISLYNSISKVVQTVYDSLDQTIPLLKKSDCLLVPEHHFIYSNTPFSFYSNTPFGIQDLKQLIQHHYRKEKGKYNQITELIHYDIAHISVDGIDQEYALGHKGQYRFLLHCIYSQSTSDLPTEQLMKQGVRILPLSYGTMMECNTLCTDDDYFILYVNHNESKLIHVKQGFYHQIHSINFGKEDLKKTYQEHHLLKYYRDPESTSPVTESIVKDISYFFSEQLIDWLCSHIKPGSNMMIVSDITKNTYCMESLKQLYSKFINGYIIPVNLNQNDPSLPTDIASVIHHIQKSHGK